jgi:hypothetical protein
MKLYLFSFIILFTFESCNSQESNVFEIEKLTKPTNYIEQESKKEFIENKELLSFGGDLIESTSKLPDSLINRGENPFLEGMVKAYQEHRPYTISPDIVWLLISQGFSRHITFNSEKYRKKFVNFEEKKDLKIDANQYIELGNPKSDWQKAFTQLTKQAAQFIEPKTIDILTSNFSTTTETSKLVSQITILETFKGYFNYEIDGRGCGIPNIVIEGTTEDWENVLKKTKYISQYDLNWWTDRLIVIEEEIIKAKKGNFNKSFWMNMVKFHTEQKYGAKSEITGWVVDFYPYFSDGTKTNFKPISDVSSLPSEYVQVPFVFTDKKMNLKLNMTIRAGIIGLTQKTDYTLKPEIGWFLTYKKNE